MTTAQTTKTAEIGVVPSNGEFAVTNMATGEVISYHLDRSSADRAAVDATRKVTNAAASAIRSLAAAEQVYEAMGKALGGMVGNDYAVEALCRAEALVDELRRDARLYGVQA